MFEEVRNAIGANWFRTFVVAFALLWVWHTFFSSVAEVGQAVNVSEQAKNAAAREKAVACKARQDVLQANLRGITTKIPRFRNFIGVMSNLDAIASLRSTDGLP